MSTSPVTNAGIYAEHFGLSGEPFSPAPNPGALYPSPQHAEARAALEIGLRQRSGLILLTGEPGTGKTSLVYSVLSELGPEVETAYVANTSLSFDDLLRDLLTDFGVATPGNDRAELLRALNQFLRGCADAQRIAAVVIDEAQNLSPQALENVRLLSNFETFDNKLLQIVLVGQPELEAKLASPELRQLANRIAVRCQLTALRTNERRRYVNHRLAMVGGRLDLFSPLALRTLLRRSRGVPRRINILCQTAMLFAYGNAAPRVSWALAMQSIRRLATLDRSGDSAGNITPVVAAPAKRLVEMISIGVTAIGVLALLVLGAGLVTGNRHTTVASTPVERAKQAPAAPAFPTTLDVDTGGAAPTSLLTIEPDPTATSRSSAAAWLQFLLAGVTAALAAATVAMLARLRRARSTIWSVA